MCSAYRCASPGMMHVCMDAHFCAFNFVARSIMCVHPTASSRMGVAFVSCRSVTTPQYWPDSRAAGAPPRPLGLGQS